MQKVSLYIRHSSCRKYEKLIDKKTFAGRELLTGHNLRPAVRPRGQTGL